jgi:hypothetical protein
VSKGVAAVDWVAHFLYCPLMFGRRSARYRWWHRIHLIPGGLLSVACGAYDRRLGASEDERPSA